MDFQSYQAPIDSKWNQELFKVGNEGISDTFADQNYLLYSKFEKKHQTENFEWPKNLIKSYKVAEISEYSPCGNFLLAKEEKSLKLWDIYKKKKLFCLNIGSDTTYHLSQHPNGKFFTLNTADRKVNFWNLQEMSIDISLTLESLSRTLAFSQNGKFFATIIKEQKIKLWNLQDQKLSFTLEGHLTKITRICFSPNDQLLASVSDDESLKIWDLDKKIELVTLNDMKNINSMTFCPSSKNITTLIESKIIKIISIEQKIEINSFSENQKYFDFFKYTPDGAYLVIGYRDSTIIFWNIETKAKDWIFFSEKIWISSLNLSSDGKSISIVYADQRLKCITFPNFDEEFTLDKRNSNIKCLSFSNDGNLLATVSIDKIIRIFNLINNSEDLSLNHNFSAVSCLVFPKNKDHLLIATKELTLWNLKKKCKEFTFEGETNSIFSVSFSYDEKFVAAGAYSNILKIWNVNTKSIHMTINCCSVNFAFSPVDHWVVIRFGTSNAKILNYENHQEEVIFTDNSFQLSCLAFSHDGRLIATYSREKLIFWNLKQKKTEFEWLKINYFVICLAFSKNGKYLAAGTTKSSVQIWNMTEMKQQVIFYGNGYSILCLAFSPDERFLASGMVGENLKMWDLNEKSVALPFISYYQNIRCFSYSENKDLAAIGLWNSKIIIYVNEKENFTFTGHLKHINCLAFSRDSRYLASGSGDFLIKIWDLLEKCEKVTFKGHSNDILCLSFNKNGELLASGSRDTTVRIWSLVHKNEEFSFKVYSSRINCLKFSPDSLLLATGAGETYMKIWNLNERKIENSIFGKSKTNCMAFSNDGEFIAVGYGSYCIKVWKLIKNGEEIASFFKNVKISTISYHPNGHFLAAGYNDGCIVVWDIIRKNQAFSLNFHRKGLKILYLEFIMNGECLISSDKTQSFKTSISDKFCSILNKTVKYCIEQKDDLKKIFQDVLISLNISRYYPCNSQSKKAVKKKIHSIISLSLIDFFYQRNSEKARKIAKYIVKFASFGIRLKYLSSFAMRLIERICDFNKKLFSKKRNYSELVLNIFINLIKEKTIIKKLMKYKEILNLVNYSNNQKFLKKSKILMKEFYNVRFVREVIREEFNIKYYKGLCFFNNILNKNYVLTQDISEETKNKIKIFIEIEAFYFELFSKCRNELGCFLEYYGYIEDKNNFSIILSNDGKNIEKFVEELKMKKYYLNQIEILNILNSFLIIFEILKKENIFFKELKMRSFLIDENFKIYLANFEKCLIKKETGIFEYLTLNSKAELKDWSINEKRIVYDLGKIILKLAISSRKKYYNENVEQCLSILKKSGLGLLGKLLRKMICDRLEDCLTLKEVAEYLEERFEFRLV